MFALFKQRYPTSDFQMYADDRERMAVSCGAPWMGKSSKRVKTAVVNREDHYGLTQRRLKKMIAGRSDYLELPDWMLEQLGRFGAEFIVLDVFRSLHDSEENDNTEVAKVLSKVKRIQNELKCAVALVHHITEAENSGDIFRGLRGA